MKLNKSIILAVSALNALSAMNASAASTAVVMPFHETYLGARPLGMGGSFVSIADDENAIFLNPAGIGKEDGEKPATSLRGAQFPNLTLGFNSGTQKLYSAYRNGGSDRNAQMEEALLAAKDAQLSYARVSLFPYFTVGRIQLGLINDFEGESYLSKSDDERTLSVRARSQTGGVIGFSMPYVDRADISLGVAVRYLLRSSWEEDIEVNEDVAKRSAKEMIKRRNKTSGYAIDTGLLYEIPNKWNPVFGLSVKNVGDASFAPSDEDSHGEIEKMNITTGMSVQPPLAAKNLSTIVSIEGERLNQKGLGFADILKVGAELRLGAKDSTAPFSFRVGHNMKGVSYGLSADLLFFQVEFASYAAAFDGPEGAKVDRRYVGRFSVDLRL